MNQRNNTLIETLQENSLKKQKWKMQAKKVHAGSLEWENIRNVYSWFVKTKKKNFLLFFCVSFRANIRRVYTTWNKNVKEKIGLNNQFYSFSYFYFVSSIILIDGYHATGEFDAIWIVNIFAWNWNQKYKQLVNGLGVICLDKHGNTVIDTFF